MVFIMPPTTFQLQMSRLCHYYCQPSTGFINLGQSRASSFRSHLPLRLVCSLLPSSWSSLRAREARSPPHAPNSSLRSRTVGGRSPAWSRGAAAPKAVPRTRTSPSRALVATQPTGKRSKMLLPNWSTSVNVIKNGHK